MGFLPSVFQTWLIKSHTYRICLFWKLYNLLKQHYINFFFKNLKHSGPWKILDISYFCHSSLDYAVLGEAHLSNQQTVSFLLFNTLIFLFSWDTIKTLNDFFISLLFFSFLIHKGRRKKPVFVVFDYEGVRTRPPPPFVVTWESEICWSIFWLWWMP